MANDPTITIEINSKIEAVLKESYEDYLEKTSEEETVLTVEEFNLHLFKIGILSNNIKKKEIELSSKKEEASKIKSELASLKRECTDNRKKIKTAYSYEYY